MPPLKHLVPRHARTSNLYERPCSYSLPAGLSPVASVPKAGELRRCETDYSAMLHHMIVSTADSLFGGMIILAIHRWMAK